ncbi:ribosomal protein S18-alanine N-acetyltransferase [Butyrivibrio sp. AE2032]|uniref:ribosomal protein S18-alanine N-acetyltransferase n=1 Tax=Butyrivibrio sp. AE2032 TaxID=1458463 RepID=UPI0005592524|nr:ribosomal protein S18-alanine N-acetyltransferase [Butyrivibrio sp. AE2032]
MTGLLIREALPEDIDSIMELEKGSIVHPWARSEFEDLISNSNKLCLVAESDEKVVCYIGAETVLDECNIGNIVTDKVYRGRGFATELMSALMDELTKRGIAKVFLEVEHDNVPALALYEKQGFERYGQRRGYYGPGKDAVLMCKDL